MEKVLERIKQLSEKYAKDAQKATSAVAYSSLKHAQHDFESLKDLIVKEMKKEQN